MIKVVLWDLDGTLLNFDMAEACAIRKCFAKFGFGECTDEMIERYSVINLRHWKMLEKNLITKEHALIQRFQEFFEREGIFCDLETAKNFNLEYQYFLSEEVFFQDHGLELVKGLKNQVKQYIVTNGTKRVQERKLNKSGLEAIVDGIYISDCVGYDKPNKKYFDYVFRDIGIYKKEEIMIIGDSLTSDMQGGNNADIICCWYNPKKEKKPENLRIDYEITNLQEVLEIIK